MEAENELSISVSSNVNANPQFNMIDPQNTDTISNPPKNSKKKKKGKAKIKSLFIPDFDYSGSVQNFNVDFSPDEQFSTIFDKFEAKSNRNQQRATIEEDDEVIDDESERVLTVSMQQIKKYGRPTIGMLKFLSRRPELIDPFDTDAPDPFTLAQIKNIRNIVPVPTHWAQKRKYLNYKKGSEISGYRLPSYLEKTGVSKMRQAILEIDEKRSLSQKQRDRARPKTGMFDLHPEALKDALFRQQTKPYLTRFGDIYYEGKELLPTQKKVHPGKISEKLRMALGITENQPPPWLAKMQKVGPPPSYPNIKIPGLTAPKPKGTQWGDFPGWGNVPIDEKGKPVWGGNPFDQPVSDDEDDEGPLWGTLQRSKDVQDGVNL